MEPGLEEARVGSGAYADAVAQVTAALSAGDVDRALETLYGTVITDALTNWLRSRWRGSLAVDQIDDAVVDALAQLYQKVRDGGTVSSPIAYLCRVAHGLAMREWRRQQTQDRLMQLGDVRREVEGVDPEGVAVAGEQDDPDTEARRVRVFSKVRALLPMVGEGYIMQVMDYAISALENGEEDLRPKDIAEALHLNQSTVRVLLHRGWKRLQDRAIRTGLLQDEDFIALGVDEYPEDADDGDDRHDG